MILNTNQHRIIMFSIIQDIFNSELGQYLAFKGGTACYFLYGLDRFSTDLDFDLLDNTAHFDEKLINLISKYGNIKKGQKVTISYGDLDVNIKIDISRKIWAQNKYEFVNFYGTTIKAQTKDSIFANKLVALSERFTNRDIYDVYFFFKNNFEINEDVIEERTGGSVINLLKKILVSLKALPKNYKILDGLGEVLSIEQKNFTKQYLIKNLIGIIEMTINTAI